jgi:hypothetical protein
MKSIKRIFLALLLVFNAIMIFATVFVFKKNQDTIYIIMCATICIASTISLLPLFLKDK